MLTALGRVDHHCQWMANKCIVSYLTLCRIRDAQFGLATLQGHRTHPAFVHFLTCVVLMAVYMGGVGISGFYYAITNPMEIVRMSDRYQEKYF